MHSHTVAVARTKCLKIILLFLLCVDFSASLSKSVLCCGDDEDTVLISNATETRKLSAAGSRQQEKECPCERPNPDNFWDKAFIPLLVLMLMFLAPTSIAIKKIQLRRQNQIAISNQIELQQRQTSHLNRQVEAVKMHLVKCPVGHNSDEACPICFEPLLKTSTEDVVSPANCNHHFHRECLETWISTAVSGEGRTGSSPRALACPTCCTSMIPFDPTMESRENDFMNHQQEDIESSFSTVTVNFSEGSDEARGGSNNDSLLSSDHTTTSAAGSTSVHSF